MAKLIDGRAIAERVYAELRDEIASLKSRGATPGLAVVLVGDDPASRAYVRAKDKMCRELALHSVKLELPATTTQEELLARVDELNRGRRRKSTKRRSFARSIRAKMWMDFIRSMSRSLRSTTTPVLCRAPPSVVCVCSAKPALPSPAPTSPCSVAA